MTRRRHINEYCSSEKSFHSAGSGCLCMRGALGKCTGGNAPWRGLMPGRILLPQCLLLRLSYCTCGEKNIGTRDSFLSSTLNKTLLKNYRKTNCILVSHPLSLKKPPSCFQGISNSREVKSRVW